jgi:hypothetical protein
VKVTKGILALRRVAASEKTRYAMNGVLLDVKSGYAVATDGKILARVRMDCSGETEPATCAVISTEDCERVAKAIPKAKQRGMPDGSAAVTLADGVFVADTGSVTLKCAPVEGHYPPYDEIMPKVGTGLKVGINAALLAELVAALSAASDKRGDTCVLEFTDAQSAVAVTIPGRAWADCAGLIMPICEGDNRPKGRWITEGSAATAGAIKASEDKLLSAIAVNDRLMRDKLALELEVEALKAELESARNVASVTLVAPAAPAVAFSGVSENTPVATSAEIEAAYAATRAAEMEACVLVAPKRGRGRPRKAPAVPVVARVSSAADLPW